MTQICPSYVFTEYKNQCYDIAFDCDGPDIVCDETNGIYLSNSIRNRIYFILGTCPNNWMGLPAIDWNIIQNANLNSSGINAIRSEIEDKLSDFMNDIELNVTFNKNCFLISIKILKENYEFSSDNNMCFRDVVNQGFVF